MEYLEGETLADRLANGPLPLEQTLRYGIEIADALDRAHRQGIVHRDLKPGNVMLTRAGRQAPRLRSGAGFRGGASGPAAFTALPTAAAEPDAGGLDPRHRPVHGARAARGQDERRADGHLRVRLGALRDGDRQEGVHGLLPGLAHLVDHEGGAGGDLVALADEPACARPRRADLSRQGSRRSLADRARRGAPAPGDPDDYRVVVRRRRSARPGRRRRTALAPVGPRGRESVLARLRMDASSLRRRRASRVCAPTFLRRRTPTSTRSAPTSEVSRFRPTAADSPSARTRRTACIASGSGTWTLSTHTRCPAPRKRSCRSGLPTAARSVSSPAGSSRSWRRPRARPPRASSPT